MDNSMMTLIEALPVIKEFGSRRQFLCLCLMAPTRKIRVQIPLLAPARPHTQNQSLDDGSNNGGRTGSTTHTESALQRFVKRVDTSLENPTGLFGILRSD